MGESELLGWGECLVIVTGFRAMKEVEGSFRMLCDLWLCVTFRELRITRIVPNPWHYWGLSSGKFSYSGNEKRDPKWCPEPKKGCPITNTFITTTWPLRLNCLPHMRQSWLSHSLPSTDCLSPSLPLPQSSLQPLCPYLGYESMAEVTGETAQQIFRDQAKGLTRKFICFKTLLPSCLCEIECSLLFFLFLMFNHCVLYDSRKP